MRSSLTRMSTPAVTPAVEKRLPVTSPVCVIEPNWNEPEVQKAIDDAQSAAQSDAPGGATGGGAPGARRKRRKTSGIAETTSVWSTLGATMRPFAARSPESVLEPDSGEQPTFEADGHAVAAPDFAAMVLTADCIPVVLGGDGAVAALHAGWRGLAAGVLEEGVRALREVGGRGGVVAVVGPCAGACCYEVGEEVHTAFGGAHRTLKGTPHYGGQAGDRRPIDLRAIAHARLHAAGVAEVRDVRACTICDERFFSHRREGARAGRQAGLAWLS